MCGVDSDTHSERDNSISALPVGASTVEPQAKRELLRELQRLLLVGIEKASRIEPERRDAI
jgi:hypothetical protein